MLSLKDYDAVDKLLLEACNSARKAPLLVMYSSHYILVGNWLAYGHGPHITIYWAIGQHMVMYPKLYYIEQSGNI